MTGAAWLRRRAARARRALALLGPRAARWSRRVVPIAPAGLRGVLYVGALEAVALRSVPDAILLGEELLPAVPGAAARVTLARLHARTGAIRRPLALLDAVPAARRPEPLVRRLRSQARALDDAPSPPPGRARPSWPGDRRVLYHVDQSLPHHAAGYSTRTHGLVTGLRRRGWDVEVHARLGYPNDRYDHLGRPAVAPIAVVDGITYRFDPDRARGQVALDPDRYLEASVASLIARATALRPAVLHAASNHVVGRAAAVAARRLGLPVIYEVRGLWHLTRASGEPAYAATEHFELCERLEARAAAAADHVFVITRAVGDRLAARGVASDKISVLPNAVDTARFVPRPRDPALALRWGLGDHPVIGYLGGLKPYEGLDDLLEAVAMLRARRGPTFRVLIVGDGEARPALEARAAALGLGDLVVFTGAQPHDAIVDYYALVDVVAFPRKPLDVCELVSPLKPFEAMATGRAIVVSSVAALAEIVAPERTGLVHDKGDVADLAAQLERCLADLPWARALGERAAAWVRAERSWDGVTARIDARYRELIERIALGSHGESS